MEAAQSEPGIWNAPNLPDQTFPDLPFDGYADCKLFPQINLEFPGLQLIRERPYIFVVNDFLSQEECDALIAKASCGLKRQSCDIRSDTGKRTSTGVVCEDEEVPGFRERIVNLTGVGMGQLQHLKISKYLEGEEFTVHSDAIVDSKSYSTKADVFADVRQQSEGNHLCKAGHNRYMTVFVYLNDCAEGGCTTFPRIGLHYGTDGGSFYDNPGPFNITVDKDGNKLKAIKGTNQLDCSRYCDPPLRIAPRRGLAVIHFASLIPELGGTVDGNVVHQSEPAVRQLLLLQI